MISYKPGKIKKVYPNSRQEIYYVSAQIRNTAKDVLSGERLPNKAKKEISNLLENINKLKKEKIK